MKWASNPNDYQSLSKVCNIQQKPRSSHNPFQELQDKIDDFRSNPPNLTAENIDAAPFIGVNSEVAAVQSPPTDTEIVAWLLKTEYISDDDNSVKVEDKAVECSNRHELLQVIKTFLKVLPISRDTILLYANRI